MTRPTFPAPNPAPERILIVRPSALGDVCRSVPVLASLRRAYPAARIDWLVNDAFREAIAAHPMLDGVVDFPRKRLGRELRTLRFAGPLAFARELRAPRYDLVIDAQGLLRSTLCARLTGARTRVGERGAPEGASLLYTRRARVTRKMHAVDRMLELVRTIGVEPVRDLRLYTTPGDRAWLEGVPALAGRRYVVLAPTSVWPAKRWPIDRFAGLAQRLLDRGDAEAIAVVGGPREREQCGPLVELAERDGRVADLVGTTTVGRLMAVIEGASLVVANDSAALHMAVGFRRPYVAIFGPTSIDRVGPAAHAEPGADRAHVLQHLEPGDTLDHKNGANAAITARVTTDEVLKAARASPTHQ